MSWTWSCLHKIWGDIKLQSWGLEEMALKPSSVHWRHMEASCWGDAERNCFSVCKSCGLIQRELQMLPQLEGCVLLNFLISFKDQDLQNWIPAGYAFHCFHCCLKMDWKTSKGFHIPWKVWLQFILNQWFEQLRLKKKANYSCRKQLFKHLSNVICM